MSSSGGIVAQPTLGSLATLVTADAATTVAADGAGHTLACVKASPPAWLSGAGAIIAAGVYEIIAILMPGVAPTTPGRFASTIGPIGSAADVLEAIAAAGIVQHANVVALGAADVPFATTTTVTVATDVTATLTARLGVQRLVVPAT